VDAVSIRPARPEARPHLSIRLCALALRTLLEDANGRICFAGGARALLPDPVIHLYWAYALARVEEMFQETPFPTGVCGAHAERECVTLDPKKITCPFCRQRAKVRSGSERER
jgi:hypothetical protein